MSGDVDVDEALDRRLGDASNILLLGSMLDARTRELHDALLSRLGAHRGDVLGVTFQSPTRWIRVWGDEPDAYAGEIGIISFSETPPHSTGLPDGVSATTVNPTDLTGIGMKLTQYLTDWGQTEATTVCFDSITELLQYTDLKSLFRFLRVVTRRIEYVGGVAHFHMDPSAHDRQTLATMSSLFDAVVEWRSEDDEISVSTRY